MRVIGRRRSVLAGALLLLVLAAGCSSDENSASDETAGSTTTEATTSTTTVASTLKPDDRYVALGSSIASGFGISVQSTPCGRSNRNYANLLAQRFELELVDVSCGAARIEHVVDTPQGENPVQLTAVTPDTKLITVSVGGNDMFYNGTAVGCGDPSAECTAPATLDTDVANMRKALAGMMDKIKAAASSATIVFVTYPREVPADKNCPELSYTNSEADLVRSMGETLEQAFVEVVKPMDVVFIDPYVATGDHTGCAPPSDRWTAGFKADDGFAYHPTALGHQVMADMIIKALGG